MPQAPAVHVCTAYLSRSVPEQHSLFQHPAKYSGINIFYNESTVEWIIDSLSGEAVHSRSSRSNAMDAVHMALLSRI